MRCSLLLSLALCGAARALLDDPDSSMKLNDADLLNRLLATAAAVAKESEPERKPMKISSLVGTQYPNWQNRAFDSPNPYLEQGSRVPEQPQPYAADGPFSDIPPDAFELEHRKDFEARHVKKDLGRLEPPQGLVEACLQLFRDGSGPASELLLHVCGELLGAAGVDQFPDELRGCACSAPRSDQRLLGDLLKMFRPIGHRREWLVLNSNNPDERLRTYIDLKK